MRHLDINRDDLLIYLKDNYLKSGKFNIAEIGVFEGSYSLLLYNTFIDSEFYGIDMWETTGNDFFFSGQPGMVERAYVVAQERLGNKPNFKLIKGKSEDISKTFEDDFFDLIYIDSDHSYDGAMNDFVNWFPKIKRGGIMSGHDFDASPHLDSHSKFGVGKALESFLKEDYHNLMLTNETYHKSWVHIKK